MPDAPQIDRNITGNNGFIRSEPGKVNDLVHFMEFSLNDTTIMTVRVYGTLLDANGAVTTNPAQARSFRADPPVFGQVGPNGFEDRDRTINTLQVHINQPVFRVQNGHVRMEREQYDALQNVIDSTYSPIPGDVRRIMDQEKRAARALQGLVQGGQGNGIIQPPPGLPGQALAGQVVVH